MAICAAATSWLVSRSWFPFFAIHLRIRCMHTKHNMQIYTRRAVPVPPKYKNVSHNNARNSLGKSCLGLLRHVVFYFVVAKLKGRKSATIWRAGRTGSITHIELILFPPALVTNVQNKNNTRLRSTAWCNAAADRRQNIGVVYPAKVYNH